MGEEERAFSGAALSDGGVGAGLYGSLPLDPYGEGDEIDQRWVDHLVDMDHLKQGMGLRGLAQRDPLVEYKSEAFDSFGDLVKEVYADFLRIMLRLEVEGGIKVDEVVPEKENPFREENLSYSRSGEFTIQDDSDLPAMADIAGEVDIEADD